MRIVIRSSRDSCVLNLPADITLKFKTSSGTEFEIGKNTSNSSVKIVKENYEILGSSRKGKPYRAPIAGYRKNLECCDPATECTEYCLIKFKGDLQQPNVLSVGKNLYLIDGSFYGTIFSVEGNNKFTVKFLLRECHSKLKDYLKYTNNYSGKFLNADGTVFMYLNSKPLITQKLKECKTVTNDVYKDPYVRSCDVSGVCYDKRIRSGMQPKKQLTCKKDCDKKCEKKYSFSYSQYNKNRVMNTYERGLERNLLVQGDGCSSIPSNDVCRSGVPCKEKSLYRKSGGDGCAGYESDIQIITIVDQSPAPGSSNTAASSSINQQPSPSTSPATVSTTPTPTATSSASNPALIGASILLNNINVGYIKNQEAITGYIKLTIKLTTNVKLNKGNKIKIQTVGGNISNELTIANVSVSENRCIKNQTVWKPSNKKFKKQGAVSAGSRLERLKLDTIKSANSKCGKDNRCITKDCEKIPNGPYFAGKPRFTGWIYNAKHREKVWPNRNISYIKNRPVPLGIPQLTNKCRSTRYKYGMINWKPQSSGTRGVYQRGFPNQRSTAKNLRVPGYRDVCDKKCDQICKDQTKRYLGNIKCKN